MTDVAPTAGGTRPERIATRGQLHAAIKAVREGAYNRGVQVSYRQIVRRSKDLAKHSDYEVCNQGTVGGWVSGKSLPRATDPRAFRSFLRACGVPPAEIAVWVGVLQKVAAEPGTPLGRVEALPSSPDPDPDPTPDTDPERSETYAPPLPADRAFRGLVALGLGLLVALVAAVLPLPGVLVGVPAVPLWPALAGVIVLVGSLAPWLRARLRYDPGVEVEQALREWSGVQAGSWEREHHDRGLLHPPLRVGWHVVAPGPAMAGHDDELLGVLDGQQRLLLVGGSGTGKSVLLLRLALAMAGRAEDCTSPYPMLVSLVSWNPTEDLDRWLRRRLEEDDPDRMGRLARHRPWTVASEALRTGRIVPLLDGLDELGDIAARAQAVMRIDDWLRHAPRPGLVLASQPLPDGSSPSPPPGTVTVQVSPLPPATARVYLEEHAGGSVWRELLPDAEESSGGGDRGPLEIALERPLEVRLAAAVYERHGQDDDAPDPRGMLSHGHLDKVRQHLISRFLPAAYRVPDPPSWTHQRVTPWLRDVARVTSGRDGASDRLVWWELRRRARIIVPLTLALPGALAVGVVPVVDYRFGIGVGAGVLAGIAVALPLLAIVRRSDPVVADDVGPGIAAGFIGGAVGAVLGGVIAVRTGLDTTPWRGVMGGLGAGIAAGAVARHRLPATAGGLVGGLVVAVTASSRPGLLAGIVDGLAVLVAGALVLHNAEDTPPAQRLGRPPPWIVVGTALPTGLSIGLLSGARHGPAVGVLAGLAIGALGGIAAGCAAQPVHRGGMSSVPGDSLRSDRRTFLLMFALGGLSFGGGAAVAVSPLVGIGALITVGIIAGATRTAWPAYAVARVWLALCGRLPLRLMRFFEDAHERGVLRRDGAGYRIRHSELSAHLLGQATTADEPG